MQVIHDVAHSDIIIRLNGEKKSGTVVAIDDLPLYEVRCAQMVVEHP